MTKSCEGWTEPWKDQCNPIKPLLKGDHNLLVQHQCLAMLTWMNQLVTVNMTLAVALVAKSSKVSYTQDLLHMSTDNLQSTIQQAEWLCSLCCSAYDSQPLHIPGGGWRLQIQRRGSCQGEKGATA